MENGIHRVQTSKPSNGLKLLEHGKLIGKIDLNATIDRRDQDLNLKAELSSTAELICDRCLRTFQQDVTARFDLFFSTKLSNLDDEIKPLSLNNPMIDLSEDIRSALVLALPIKLLCIENCRGLCPTCGANWNDESCSCHSEFRDPRWDKLKELQII